MNIIKHRPAGMPFECSHCGIIQYGHYSSTGYDLDNVLCSSCQIALDDFMEKYEENNGHYFSLEKNTYAYDEKTKKLFSTQANAWIEDKTKKPYPLPHEKRFNRNIPKWMQSAINLGMLQTTKKTRKNEPDNDEIMYIVYSENDVAIQVESINKYDIKSKTGLGGYKFTRVTYLQKRICP